MITMTANEQRRRTRLLATIVGGVVPALISIVATVLMISWLPELPDPIAIHWSGSEPDGFGPAAPLAFLPVGITVAFAAFAVGAAWSTTPSGRPSWNQKFVLVTGIWMASLLSVGIGGSVAAQRGLSDAHDVGDIYGFLLTGALIGLALAVTAWFVLPQAGLSEMPTEQPAPLVLAPSERVSWSQSVRITQGAAILISAALLLSLATVVFTGIAASSAFAVASCSFTAVALFVLGTCWWRVTVDRRGLRVNSALGWPRIAIPLDDIHEVRAVSVNPTAEFGGWGWRWDNAGRSGVIMRKGPAIEVTRSSGKRFVVTVADASTAASLLAALSKTPAR